MPGITMETDVITVADDVITTIDDVENTVALIWRENSYVATKLPVFMTISSPLQLHTITFQLHMKILMQQQQHNNSKKICCWLKFFTKKLFH